MAVSLIREMTMDKLSEFEIELLKNHGSFYQALLNGDVPADDPEKIHFLRVFKRGFPPVTEHEIAYKKYLSLKLQRAAETKSETEIAEIEQCPSGCRSYSSQMIQKWDIQYEHEDPPWDNIFKYG
jgi:hypothetical protein